MPLRFLFETQLLVRAKVYRQLGLLPPPQNQLKRKQNQLQRSRHTQDHLTLIDAPLPEAWRMAAKDPDHQVGQWLLYGAPAGILHQPVGPGIFPDASGPPQINPNELYCDVTAFRNYAGVEEHSTTEAEMQAHIDKHHLRKLVSYEELAEYVGGKS